MFRVKVLNFKDIVKFMIGVFFIIGIITFTSKYFIISNNKSKETKDKVLKKSSISTNLRKISFGSMTKCLDVTIPTLSELNEEYNKISKEDEEESKENINYLQEFLKVEISSIKGIEEIEKEAKKENIESKNKKENGKKQSDKNKLEANSSELILASNEILDTEIVTNNPIAEKYNVQYGSVKIKNGTEYQLTEDILKPDIQIDNKNILIFHTHSCESYTSSEKYPYTPTGNYRTTDLNYTVTRVGTELENYLKKYDFNVIHDKSYHDYPAYNGSYTRSLATVENILSTNPSDIIIDLHRDAVGSREDYAPTVKIGEDYCAQIMFVIGTNEGGLWHPNWQQNLKFAIKVQEKANEMYPGLFKPIMLTNSRYNQHTGKYANIMEVGATGNTLEQCLASMKYLSAVLEQVGQS